MKASFDTTKGRMIGAVIKVNPKTVIVKLWSKDKEPAFNYIKRHKEKHHIILGEGQCDG